MPEAEPELERVYTVPLSRAWIAPRHRRVVRAVNILREFAGHHMKSEEIKIDSELNETLWRRGITRPPRRITVKMTKDEDGLVTVSLPKTTEEEEELKGTKEEALPAPEGAPKPEAVKEEKKPEVKAIPSEAKPRAKKKEPKKKAKKAPESKKKKPKAKKK